MGRPWTLVEWSLLVGIGGSVLAVAIPSFIDNLAASKWSEPIEGLDRIVRGTLTYSEGKAQDLSFPPSAPLTPEQVPRGELGNAPPEAWEHLTWKSLRFRMDHPHAYAFKFESYFDANTKEARFAATAHGDLDGDGTLSTFQVRGVKQPGEGATVIPGMFVHREVE